MGIRAPPAIVAGMDAYTDDVDVLVVGAGHSGLAMSALLSDAGREHLVVERRDRLGGGWRDRWDGFTLVTPNWTGRLPGLGLRRPGPGRLHGPRRDRGQGRPLRAGRAGAGGARHGGAATDAAGRRGLPRQDQPRRRVRPAGRGRDRELSHAAHPADGAAHLRPRRAAALARLPQPGGPARRRRARRRVGADGAPARRGALRGRPARLRLGRVGGSRAAPLSRARHLLLAPRRHPRRRGLRWRCRPPSSSPTAAAGSAPCRRSRAGRGPRHEPAAVRGRRDDAGRPPGRRRR